ncbi:hypothetical protein F8A87_04355 [Betaproteobacteria bacterium SCN2]|jgi:GR25 family glycosyltransferase involved in LPS biosynthesis|nr:hypothetical protein F8A87_04355 [Betaproteobacteria bacterium SCN2]
MDTPKTSIVAYVLAIDSIEERMKNARDLMDSLESLDVVQEVSLAPAIYWKEPQKITEFLTRFPEHTFTRKFLRKYRMGQVATALSHISIWHRLLESKHDAAVVFEDDIHISDVIGFRQTMFELRDRQNPEWLRIHLHKRFRDQVLSTRAGGLFADDPMPWGFATYYVTRSGARKMLECCRQMDGPIDWLPPLLKQRGLMATKTVTEVVVEHHDFNGDKSELSQRHKIESTPDTIQKFSSTIWTSPSVSGNIEMFRFLSRLARTGESRSGDWGSAYTPKMTIWPFKRN